MKLWFQMIIIKSIYSKFITDITIYSISIIFSATHFILIITIHLLEQDYLNYFLLNLFSSLSTGKLFVQIIHKLYLQRVLKYTLSTFHDITALKVVLKINPGCKLSLLTACKIEKRL